MSRLPLIFQRGCQWAIKSYFGLGKLLKEVNATIITLVPKKLNPSSMGKFKPIWPTKHVNKKLTKIINLETNLWRGVKEVEKGLKNASSPRVVGG